MKTEPIVVVGGGFGGLRTALDLDKRLGHELAVPLFLVDPSPFHLYTPTLFEVASAPEPKVAAIPFEELLEGTNIRFIQERVVSIDTELKHVITEKRRLAYGDVVLALGSQTKPVYDKGDETEAILQCQTLDDVLAIRHRLAECFAQARALPGSECHNHIIVVGGGPTGVEFAAGLRQYIHDMADYYGVSAKGVHITIVEEGKDLVPQLPKKARLKIKQQLQSLGVSLRLHTRMSWRGGKKLMLDGATLPINTVVWTIGVLSHPLVRSTKGLRHDPQGRVLVDSTLQAVDSPHVWAVGDSAAVLDSGTAEAAIAHGQSVALSLTDSRVGRPLTPYHPQKLPIVMPLSSTYGIAIQGDRVREGRSIIWQKQWRTFQYYASILPLASALTLWFDGGRALASHQSVCLAWSKKRKPA